MRKRNRGGVLSYVASRGSHGGGTDGQAQIVFAGLALYAYDARHCLSEEPLPYGRHAGDDSDYAPSDCRIGEKRATIKRLWE